MSETRAHEMERHDSKRAGEEAVGERFAYITLLTKATYLAGVVVLAHTLKKQGSQYPLIVLYTSTLTDVAVHALKLEAGPSNLILQKCDLLVPAEHHKLNVAVERFTDTWTKLRVFDSASFGFDKICYLDADMTIRRNMDYIFDSTADLPKDWIAAAHDCVCSPNRMPWTPADHCKENCAFTPQRHPKALAGSIAFDQYSVVTYNLFNSGMFVFHPSQQLWDDMMKFFDTTDLLGTFKFPDQDFLIRFFHGRFMPVSWKYNAVKTMAYRHTNIWRSDEIVCLHYIVDKPWAKRIGADGIAGFNGQDGETHAWWWEDYEVWMEERELEGYLEIIGIMKNHVASDNDDSDSERPDMSAIGAKVHGATTVGGKENQKVSQTSQTQHEQHKPHQQQAEQQHPSK